MYSMKVIFAGFLALLMSGGLAPTIAAEAGGTRPLGGAAAIGDTAPTGADAGGAGERRPGDPIPGIDITVEQGGGRAIDDDSDGDSIDTSDDESGGAD